jgi:nitrite reductase/ring-hydroxylating ferredoxin subunit
MPKWFVGQQSDFGNDMRRIVRVDGDEVVVFRREDEYFAFNNWCLHMGGPVGEGHLMCKVEGVVSLDKSYKTDAYSNSAVVLVCPWHGWEYEIGTGRAVANPSLALKKYEVEVDGDSVYVIR